MCKFILVEDVVGMCIDKWLWVVCFFKMCFIVKNVIEGGKVYYNGECVKVLREVWVGMEFII